MSELDRLISILSSVLEGEVECANGQDEVDRLNWGHLTQVEALYGNLHHYWDDEDIRKRDSGYKELQDTELRKLIDHLRSDRLDKAKDISFLHRSE